jgi:hypothetical protein
MNSVIFSGVLVVPGISQRWWASDSLLEPALFSVLYVRNPNSDHFSLGSYNPEKWSLQATLPGNYWDGFRTQHWGPKQDHSKEGFAEDGLCVAMGFTWEGWGWGWCNTKKEQWPLATDGSLLL